MNGSIYLDDPEFNGSITETNSTAFSSSSRSLSSSSGRDGRSSKRKTDSKGYVCLSMYMCRQTNTVIVVMNVFGSLIHVS